MTFTTDKDVPPPMKGMYGVSYWERSIDPFCMQAFKGVEPALAAAVSKSPEISKSTRYGWMATDYAENSIGFVVDGSVFEGEPEQYEITSGYFKDGRMFAYPTSENYIKGTNDLKKRHEEYRNNSK